MAVAPSTNMLFVGTRKTTVWAVTDRNSDGVADEVKAFAPSLKFKVPNGVCWTRGRLPDRRRAQPHPQLPGRRVLLRRPGRRRDRGRAAGQADPGRGGVVQPRRAHLPRRHGRHALRRAGPAVQRAAARQAQALRRGGHRRHRSHERRSTAASARSTRAASATRSASSSTRRTSTLWFTDNQTDGMGDDIPAGRDQPRDRRPASSSATRGSQGKTRDHRARLRQGSAAGQHHRRRRC